MHSSMPATISPPQFDRPHPTWLWPLRIPRGKITLLAGDPGLGKSFIALDIAARLSRALPLPELPNSEISNSQLLTSEISNPEISNSKPPISEISNPEISNSHIPLAPNQQINNSQNHQFPPNGPIPPAPLSAFPVQRSALATLIISAEDDLQDTIFPRLRAAGANLDLIHPFRCLDSYKENYEPFSFKTDLDDIRSEIESTSADFIIIDPITSFMAGIDHNSTAAIRQHLTPLAQIAAFYGVAILAITHFTKQGHRHNIHRAAGSLALAAIARSVHTVTRAPAGTHCLFAPVKSNLVSTLAPLPFRIHDGKVDWLPASSNETDSLDSPSQPQDFSSEFFHQQEIITAVDFLRESLAAGPQSAVPLIRQAKSLAISERTLKRAKSQIAIRSLRHGLHWFWLLPNQSLPTLP